MNTALKQAPKSVPAEISVPLELDRPEVLSEMRMAVWLETGHLVSLGGRWETPHNGKVHYQISVRGES